MTRQLGCPESTCQFWAGASKTQLVEGRESKQQTTWQLQGPPGRGGEGPDELTGLEPLCISAFGNLLASWSLPHWQCALLPFLCISGSVQIHALCFTGTQVLSKPTTDNRHNPAASQLGSRARVRRDQRQMSAESVWRRRPRTVFQVSMQLTLGG